MLKRKMLIAVGAALLPVVFVAAASAQVTVYNNFGEDHDGWNYNWGLGWTVAGEDVPNQYGVEQAMGFTSTASGYVCDIWVAMWYVPNQPDYDEVTLRLARNPDNLPPTPEDVMEEWVITDFESWYDWSPPHHLVGNGSSYLEEGASYWLWAIGGETTCCGWCMNEDPYLTCPHTLRREGEDWLPIGNETASAFRVDVMPGEPCVGDLDGDGDTDQADLGILLADWGCDDPVNGCAGDLDGDDKTDQADLGILLGDWGCGVP